MKDKPKDYDELTPQEKEQLSAAHKAYYINWLYFIIKDKKQYAQEYTHKPKAQAIYLREAKAYQKELDLLIGFTTEPSKFDNMSPERKALYDQLINKQIVLVACKKDETFCDNIKAEIRVIERQIKELELKESGKEEIKEDDYSNIPF